MTRLLEFTVRLADKEHGRLLQPTQAGLDQQDVSDAAVSSRTADAGLLDHLRFPKQGSPAPDGSVL